jgi:tetratricopeptide (TPR) repeat protein
MGEFDPDDKKFQKWQKLRSDLKDAKREKDQKKIISVCQKVIELDQAAKYIRIFIPIFEKAMAKAYSELGQPQEALAHYRKALQGFRVESGDWAKDIAGMEKAIAKLESGPPVKTK